MTFNAVLESWTPGRHCLNLSGRLDSTTRAQFEPQATELASQDGVFLVLNCEELDYVASAGLRVFLMAAKRVQQHGGRMVVCGLQPAVREVFEISGFLKILTVVADVAAARALAEG